MKKMILLGMAFLLLLLAGCGATPDASQPTPVADVDALLRGYTAVADEQYLYYCQPDGLYREDLSSGDRLCLVKTECLFYLLDEHAPLQLDGGYLYYVLSDNGLSLCRIPTAGGTSEVLLTAADLPDQKFGDIRSYKVHQGTVYASCVMILYRYSDNGWVPVHPDMDINCYDFAEDKLYYIEHASRTFTIYQQDLSTGQTTVLLGDDAYNPDGDDDLYKHFALDGDTVYYSHRSPEGIYRYKGGEHTLLFDNSAATYYEFTLSVIDGILYFAHIGTDGTPVLMAYDPAADAVTQVAVMPAFSHFRDFRILDGVVYYLDSEDTIHSAVLE